jgi:hypothetical protein
MCTGAHAERPHDAVPVLMVANWMDGRFAKSTELEDKTWSWKVV